MPLLRVAGALSFQLLSPPALGAQAPPSAPDPRDVVAIALRHNPDILAARLRTDSAVGEQRIARAIPNPVVNSAPNQPWQYTVTVPLDVTPQRFLRTRAAARASDAALSDAADVVRQVTFAVRQAYVDVLLAEQQRELATERRDIFRQLLAADSARLRAGDVPQRDVIKAELELARADADRMRSDAQVHAARLALQLLMGVGTHDTAFTVAGGLAYAPVEIPADSLEALAAQRPDLQAAHARVEQSAALRSLANSLWIPLPELTYSYQHGGQFARGDLFTNGSSYALGFGFSLPLFYWNGGERQRSAAGLEQATVATRHVEAQVANDVATALDGYRSARSLAERYEGGLLAEARSVLETARYAYGTGAISLLELLDAIATWSDTRSDYITAVHDYWVSVYGLSRAVGRD
ncbi:MAG: TolC family protein, partial [Gemmatimonadales bacterium]